MLQCHCSYGLLGSVTLPRKILINPQQTPYYHCVNRCVRRAFLCGKDTLTGYDFDHRRSWIEARLKELAGIFAIDLCAYAVMSNHYHVVLHVNTEEQANWSDKEVVDRWTRLYRLPEWFDRIDSVRRSERIDLWRDRLGNVSWFMRNVNEPLARQANNEDGCKGRFWEGRFRSQALLDDTSLLKCMAYVDLNPIRAKMAATPEVSLHTSIKARIEGNDSALAPTSDTSQTRYSLPIEKLEYLSLVDWTGRQFREDKRGKIDAGIPPIIERLQTHPAGWYEEVRNLTRKYFRAIGSVTSLTAFRDHLGQQRLKGLST